MANRGQIVDFTFPARVDRLIDGIWHAVGALVTRPAIVLIDRGSDRVDLQMFGYDEELWSAIRDVALGDAPAMTPVDDTESLRAARMVLALARQDAVDNWILDAAVDDVKGTYSVPAA